MMYAVQDVDKTDNECDHRASCYLRTTDLQFGKSMRFLPLLVSFENVFQIHVILVLHPHIYLWTESFFRIFSQTFHT